MQIWVVISPYLLLLKICITAYTLKGVANKASQLLTLCTSRMPVPQRVHCGSDAAWPKWGSFCHTVMQSIAPAECLYHHMTALAFTAKLPGYVVVLAKYSNYMTLAYFP